MVSGGNGRLVRHPAIVVVVASEADVQKAVLFTRKHFLMLTVATSNGDVARGSYYDASLLIHLSQLNSVSANVDLVNTNLDPGTMTAQPGATWQQAVSAAASVGREIVAPSAAALSLPVADMIQAGGFGPSSRLRGLMADHLVSARVVTMDGSVVDVSASGATIVYNNGVSKRTTLDPGLWNAIRGGGAGSFGVAVSLTFRMFLPTSGYVTRVTATFALYDNAQFVGRAPLQYLLPAVAALPEQWGGSVYLSGVPSQSSVGQKGLVVVDLIHHGVYNSASYLAVTDILNYDNSGARLSLSVSNSSGVVTDFGFTIPVARREYAFTTNMDTSVLTDTVKLDQLVDTLLLVLNNPTVDSSYLCEIQPLGGVIPTLNSSARVTASLRDAGLNVACGLRWDDADGLRDELFENHALGLAHRMKAFGTGTYMGYGLFEDEPDWKHALYGANYAELLRVKRKYDIDNFLWCHNCVASDFRLDCNRGCERYGDDEHQRRHDREHLALEQRRERDEAHRRMAMIHRADQRMVQFMSQG